MAHFVKLYASILDSSIWSEDPCTRLLWITMLGMADPDGLVTAAVPGLARRANIPLEACEAGLGRLQAPDPYSKSREKEGRRIEVVPEVGWRIINYKSYRELRTEHQVAEAARMRAYRERTRTERTECSEKDLPLPLSVSSSVEERAAGEKSQSPTPRRGTSPANPLIAGRRSDLELECLRLVREIAALTGEDPVEVIAHASGYEGASTTKLNPATMSDDRLAHTLRDLRADAAELRKNAPAKLWVDTCQKIDGLSQETWLHSTKGLSLEDSTLTVQVPTEEHARWLRVKYIVELQAALGATRLRFVTLGASRPATAAPGPASSSEGGTIAPTRRPSP